MSLKIKDNSNIVEKVYDNNYLQLLHKSVFNTVEENNNMCKYESICDIIYMLQQQCIDSIYVYGLDTHNPFELCNISKCVHALNMSNYNNNSEKYIQNVYHCNAPVSNMSRNIDKTLVLGIFYYIYIYIAVYIYRMSASVYRRYLFYSIYFY